MKTKQDLANEIIDLLTVRNLPNGKRRSRRSIAEYLFNKSEYYYMAADGSMKKYNQLGIEKVVQLCMESPNKITGVKINDKNNADIHERIKSHLFVKGKICTLSELSDMLDCGISKVRNAINTLHNTGHTIKIKDDIVLFDSTIPKEKETVLSVNKMTDGFHKIGVCGDNHLCSKYERLDVLNALYDMYEQEGVSVVYNTGNWIDGESKFNKHSISVHGMDNQIDYFLKNYPKRSGVTTRLITGDDHEGWYTQREGVNIGKYMQMKAAEQGRDDIVFIGHMEHDEVILAKNGRTVIRIVHPGGGSSYATSYAVQKIVESYTGGDKPDILFIGHYHKADYVFCRGVHCVQTGCTQDQSPFMRKKKLAAHLGGWIVEFGVDKNGAVTRFKQEFIPFYDKSYYENWKYKW